MTPREYAFNQLWAFSLDRYGRDGVSDACLKLQDRLHADVNIVLLCLWMAQDGRQLAPDTLREIVDGAAGAWHRDVVVPIRTARKAMKGRTAGDDGANVEATRDRVKAVEIACEKLEQQLLAEAVDEQRAASPDQPAPLAERRALARNNLTAYVGLIAPDAHQSSGALIETLASSCIT